MSNIEQPPMEKLEVASTALEETGLKVDHPTVNEALLTGLDGAYVEKAELVAAALRTIGMNRWQYLVWAVCGFGWVVDNIAGYGMSVTYTPVANEFVISDVAITGIAYNLGAFIGALFWFVNLTLHRSNRKTYSFQGTYGRCDWTQMGFQLDIVFGRYFYHCCWRK